MAYDVVSMRILKPRRKSNRHSVCAQPNAGSAKKSLSVGCGGEAFGKA
jgi:hypothetical protein